MKKAQRVRRAPRASVGGGTIHATFEVTAEVVGGSITQAQFADWIRTAISDYHRWRVGWVGLAMHCSLKNPVVVVHEPPEDS